MIIIRKDTVWGPGEGYLYDDVQIASGATLTIMPGAKIYGNGHKIDAFGKLSIKGTSSSQIFIEDTKIGLSGNYENPGKVEISYAHLDKGGLASYHGDLYGYLDVNNSIITNMSYQIYAASFHKGSVNFQKNVVLNSAGIKIFNTGYADIGFNVFDRYDNVPTDYGYFDAGLAIEAETYDNVGALSHDNAFLSVGSESIKLGRNESSITSLRDYFGTTKGTIIQSMITDNSDDLKIDNIVNLKNVATSPSSNIVKTTFSFTTLVLPREVLLNARLVGNADADLIGNKLANNLSGNAGDNVLDGGLGADTMAGGAGNDTYVVDNARDMVVESRNQGTDSVVASVSYALADNVENLTLSGTKAINATGNALANHLVGNGAANVLDGKGGIDVMEGGAGNDTYFVNHAKDMVIEAIGGGRDAVITTVSYTLAAEQQIEILQTADIDGTAALKLTGNAFGNKLIGNAGNNLLDGRGGIDEMRGGAGDDTYIVDHARDIVVEAAKGGTDTVKASASYVLKAGQEIESLHLVGSAKLNLTGNEFGQSLVGNAADNILDGGLGADVLTGGKGADTFVFASALGPNNVDRITDFTATDTIRLAKSIFSALAPGELKAEAFKDIAKTKVDADDHILYDSRNGSLFYDADGSGKAAAVKFAVLDNKATISHADFLIA